MLFLRCYILKIKITGLEIGCIVIQRCLATVRFRLERASIELCKQIINNNKNNILYVTFLSFKFTVLLIILMRYNRINYNELIIRNICAKGAKHETCFGGNISLGGQRVISCSLPLQLCRRNRATREFDSDTESLKILTNLMRMTRRKNIGKQ